MLPLTLRVVFRQPGYHAAMVLLLATGVSLSTATFTIADGVLFKSLPYRAPDELYCISGVGSVLSLVEK
jgi:hypothetical protein